MTLTPRQRAATMLFGIKDYPPHNPDYQLIIQIDPPVWISFNELVRRYEAEDAANAQ